MSKKGTQRGGDCLGTGTYVPLLFAERRFPADFVMSLWYALDLLIMGIGYYMSRSHVIV